MSQCGPSEPAVGDGQFRLNPALTVHPNSALKSPIYFEDPALNRDVDGAVPLADDGPLSNPARRQYEEYDDIRAVVEREFGEAQRKVVAPAARKLWWNDPVKLKKLAEDFVARKANRSCVHANLHLKFINYYGSRYFSLSQERPTPAMVDTHGYPLPDADPAIFDGASADNMYQYFSFSILDADDREFPFLVEFLHKPSSDGLDTMGPMSVIYTFEAGARGVACGVVRPVCDGYNLTSISDLHLDYDLLCHHMPSFRQYKPHLTSHRSLSYHAIALNFPVNPGCLHPWWWSPWVAPMASALKAGVTVLERALKPQSLRSVMRMSVDELVAHEEEKERSNEYVQQWPFRDLRDAHQRMMSTLDAEAALRLEVEEQLILGIALMSQAWTTDIGPLLPHLTALQPETAIADFNEHVRHALAATASSSDSSSSSSPPCCSASLTPLIPELERIVGEYAPFELPFVEGDFSPEDDPNWKEIRSPEATPPKGAHSVEEE